MAVLLLFLMVMPQPKFVVEVYHYALKRNKQTWAVYELPLLDGGSGEELRSNRISWWLNVLITAPFKR